jgi:hypothetical protein
VIRFYIKVFLHVSPHGFIVFLYEEQICSLHMSVDLDLRTTSSIVS